MFETDNRPDLTATIFIDYLNTTNMCIRFAYQIRNYARILVGAYSEDKAGRRVGELGIEDDNGLIWKTFWSTLPPGLHMISIKGVREYSGLSFIAIDDVEIAACPNLYSTFNFGTASPSYLYISSCYLDLHYATVRLLGIST